MVPLGATTAGEGAAAEARAATLCELQTAAEVAGTATLAVAAALVRELEGGAGAALPPLHPLSHTRQSSETQRRAASVVALTPSPETLTPDFRTPGVDMARLLSLLSPPKFGCYRKSEQALGRGLREAEGAGRERQGGRSRRRRPERGAPQ